jgi:hypothetical protein
MDESMIREIPQITPEENEVLVAEFSEKEVCDAFFQMKHNKASGPDDFPIEVYQVFLFSLKMTL